MNKQDNQQYGSDEYRLIQAVLAGDHNQFESLVSRYQQLVFGMIKRQVRDEMIAKDLSQETFLKAYRGLKNFRNYSTFSTWLTRIALNVTNSYFSSRRYRESLKNVDLDSTHMLSLTTHAPLETGIHNSAVLLLQQCIGALKPKFREVIVLCALEGKTYQEAAEILQVPTGTVCSRMNTALTQLRRSFSRQRNEDEL